MFICFRVVLVLLASIAALPSARAHEDHCHAGTACQSVRINALREHFEDRVADLAAGKPRMTENEARLLGQELIDAVVEEELEELREQLPPTVARRFGNRALEILRHLNPVHLASVVLDKAVAYGAAGVIAAVISEGTEQLGTVLAIKYHALLPLVPLFQSHVPDILMFKVMLEVPRALRLARVWARYGDTEAMARHLAEQRARLPLDFSITIGELFVGELRVALLREPNWISRIAPKPLEALLEARRFAQQAVIPSLTVRDLEKWAREHDVAFHFLEAYRSSPALYASLLIHEIRRDSVRALEFESSITSGAGGEIRSQVFGTSNDIREVSNRAMGLYLSSGGNTALAAQTLARAGEPLDVVAERMRSYYLSRYRAAKTRAKKTGLKALWNVPWRHSTRLRAGLEGGVGFLTALSTGDEGLERLGAVPKPKAKTADWQALFETMLKTEGALLWIEQALPSTQTCEGALL